MSYFLIFLAVLVIAGVAFFVVGQQRRYQGLPLAHAVSPSTEVAGSEKPLEQPGAAQAILDDSLAEPVPHLPPVLLPAGARAEDLDRIRFSVALRGYRMDQVDQVLDSLSTDLEQQAARIRELERELASKDAPAEDAVIQPAAAEEEVVHNASVHPETEGGR
ncbi:DivIVA domain-containing protein [Psychromicrobium xiongbiense]|uniref:DivIVA domain-containing protein n=1 Tax=Psychromicrobium xiongbiense TaxID=3051184 RepID=UPI002556D533|nr:DivIVA domain-containing protein [Psychromicrobium sp. YIM S02556]